MSTTLPTAVPAHKSILSRIIASIGIFMVHLFTGAGNGFNELAPAMQQGAVNGSQISQILKLFYAKGEAFVIQKITDVTGLPADVATQAVLSVAKDAGINTTSVQAYLDHIADTVQAGVTDNKWNALWQDVAKFAANYLTQGKLDWVTLSIGIIEYVFQTFVLGTIS